MIDPIFFLLTFIILQIFDIITTYITISTNKGNESNPIMKFLFDKFGVLPSLIIFKSAIVIFLTIFHTQLPLYFWIIVILLYLGVILNNSWVLYKS